MWTFLKELWYLILHKDELEAMAYLRYGHPTYTLEWFESLSDYLIYKIWDRIPDHLVIRRNMSIYERRVYLHLCFRRTDEYAIDFIHTKLKKIIREELILNELNR